MGQRQSQLRSRHYEIQHHEGVIRPTPEAIDLDRELHTNLILFGQDVDHLVKQHEADILDELGLSQDIAMPHYFAMPLVYKRYIDPHSPIQCMSRDRSVMLINMGNEPANVEFGNDRERRSINPRDVLEVRTSEVEDSQRAYILNYHHIKEDLFASMNPNNGNDDIDFGFATDGKYAWFQLPDSVESSAVPIMHIVCITASALALKHAVAFEPKVFKQSTQPDVLAFTCSAGGYDPMTSDNVHMIDVDVHDEMMASVGSMHAAYINEFYDMGDRRLTPISMFVPRPGPGVLSGIFFMH